MSVFKDQIAKDLGAVWFSDREEFWETHNVNDAPMSIIVDSDELRRRSARRVYSSSDSGVYASQKLIMARAEEFGKKPAINSRLKLDALYYRVSDVDDQAGLYIIALEAWKS